MNSRIVIGVCVLALVAILVLAFVLFGNMKNDAFSISQGGSADASAQVEEGEPAASPDLIYVHVSGCVNVPGVCSVPEGSRVADAVDAAGGFSEDAARDSVNLARIVEDGEQIVIASIAQAASAEQGALAGIPSEGSRAQSSAAGKININTASASELQALNGIGESKAEKIVAYREENGFFKSVDELKNVSGIGEKTLENIRGDICV